MLTNKDYCDYETCVALMEIGYPPYAFGDERWDEHFANISLYEAQKWLREEKKIEVNASFDKKDDGWIAFIQRLDYPDLYGTDVFSTVYNTYEAALLVSIKEAVKILTNNKNE